MLNTLTYPLIILVSSNILIETITKQIYLPPDDRAAFHTRLREFLSQSERGLDFILLSLGKQPRMVKGNTTDCANMIRLCLQQVKLQEQNSAPR